MPATYSIEEAIFFFWMTEGERKMEGKEKKKKDFFMFYGSAPLAIGNWVFIPSDQKILGKADEVKKKNHGRHTAVASGVFKNKKMCKNKKKIGKEESIKKKKKKSPDLEETNQVVKTFEKIRIFQPPSICLLTCPFPSLLLL